MIQTLETTFHIEAVEALEFWFFSHAIRKLLCHIHLHVDSLKQLHYDEMETTTRAQSIKIATMQKELQIKHNECEKSQQKQTE